jgi:hypothetical protein
MVNRAGAKRPHPRTVAGFRRAHQSLNMHAARCGTFLCGEHSRKKLRHDGFLPSCNSTKRRWRAGMRVLPVLVVHLFVTTPKMLRPGGVRAVAAESLLLERPLIITHRARHRAPNRTIRDRFAPIWISRFVNPRRRAKTVVVLKQVTLLRVPNAVVMGSSWRPHRQTAAGFWHHLDCVLPAKSGLLLLHFNYSFKGK